MNRVVSQFFFFVHSKAIYTSLRVVLVELPYLLFLVQVVSEDRAFTLHSLIFLLGEVIRLACAWMALIGLEAHLLEHAIGQELDYILGIVHIRVTDNGALALGQRSVTFAAREKKAAWGLCDVEEGKQRVAVPFRHVDKGNSNIVCSGKGATGLAPLDEELAEHGVILRVEEDHEAGGAVHKHAGVKVARKEAKGLADTERAVFVFRLEGEQSVGRGGVLGGARAACAEVVGGGAAPAEEGVAGLDGQQVGGSLVVDELGDELRPAVVGELAGGSWGGVCGCRWDVEDGRVSAHGKGGGQAGMVVRVRASQEHGFERSGRAGEMRQLGGQGAAMFAPAHGYKEQGVVCGKVGQQGGVGDVVDESGSDR